MAKSNYWRGGKHVVNISPREWRVGNVPPESGVYPNGRDVDIKKMNKPSYQALISMIQIARKKGATKVVLGIYHTGGYNKPQPGPGERVTFNWVRISRRPLAEFEMQVRAAIARHQDINQFATAVMNLNYSAGTVMAWALLEVK